MLNPLKVNPLKILEIYDVISLQILGQAAITLLLTSNVPVTRHDHCQNSTEHRPSCKNTIYPLAHPFALIIP
jgi:hypothetical protein